MNRKSMYSFDYHFNNLRFNNTQIINGLSAAHVLIYFVSSEIMKGILFNLFLDHPTKPRRSRRFRYPPRRKLV